MILFFLSGQNPHLLQYANFVTRSYYFFCFPYFVSNSHHYFGLIFIFYCDFVFACFKLLLFFYSFCTLWTFILAVGPEILIVLGFWLLVAYFTTILFRQLIVFLWSFFFLKSLVEGLWLSCSAPWLAVLKILKFLISMFIFIFWFFEL